MVLLRATKDKSVEDTPLIGVLTEFMERDYHLKEEEPAPKKARSSTNEEEVEKSLKNQTLTEEEEVTSTVLITTDEIEGKQIIISSGVEETHCVLVASTNAKGGLPLPLCSSPVETHHVAVASNNVECGIPLVLPSLPVKSSVGKFSRKKLLVLDLNGLLADIVCNPPKDCKPDVNIARRAVFKRPFCNEFLRFCFERFQVGVWSSRNKKNVWRVIDFLLGDLKHNLLFTWDQYHCTETKFRTLENKHKTLALKELRKLWEKEDTGLPWEKGDYNESNTLLVDDSPYKALLNPLHTAIFPTPYGFQDQNDTSLGEGGDIRRYLEELSVSENVQEYIQKHPFGQPAITEASESWNFYLEVITSLTPPASNDAVNEDLVTPSLIT